MIEILGLYHPLGDFVLNVPELGVPSARYAVILGPCGSGKTMLLRVLTGLIRPAFGIIRIGGRDVSALPPERRHVALVPQEPSLFPHRSVRENVAYGLMVRGVPRRRRAERVDQLVDTLRLQTIVDRPVRSLSGGESQKVALARALATRPEVLVLDEPLCNVDRPARHELVRELKRLHLEEGVTTVHVTHDYREARALADVYIIMRAGKVARCFQPNEASFTATATSTLAAPEAGGH